MAASTTRRISQPNSRYRACIKISSLKKNQVAVRPSPLAQPHPRKHRRETSFAAKIQKPGRFPTAPLASFIRKQYRAAMPPLAPFHPRKHCRETSFAARIRKPGRWPTAQFESFIRKQYRAAMPPLAPFHPRKYCRETSSRPKSESPVGARSLRLRSLIRATTPRATLRQQVAACRTSRRATATTCAASPAQVLPRDSIRGQNPKARSVPRPHRLRGFTRDQLPCPAIFTSGNFACGGMELIYGSAIKTSRKGRRISKLQNSNRR